MNRLKQLRIEADESQEYVGMLIGVSGQAVGQYELGKRGLSQEKLLILAEHYNCTTDYLLGKSDMRNAEKVDINDIDLGFAAGYKGLTDANKETLRNIMEGLLAKQELEDKTDDKKE